MFKYSDAAVVKNVAAFLGKVGPVPHLCARYTLGSALQVAKIAQKKLVRVVEVTREQESIRFGEGRTSCRAGNRRGSTWRTSRGGQDEGIAGE
jgi:hypothetical protein